jgi:hypothetical protein
MYSNSNLQFPNYNEVTETNDKLANSSNILVYQDSEHTIYIEVNNAAPFEVYLVDTFHDQDYYVIDNVDSNNLQAQLIDYLNEQ